VISFVSITETWKPGHIVAAVASAVSPDRDPDIRYPMVHLFSICFHTFTRARRHRAATTRRPVNSFRTAIHSQSTDDCDASVVVDVASVQLCTRPTLPAVFLCFIHRYVKRICKTDFCACLLPFQLAFGLACGQPVSWVRFLQFFNFLSDSLSQCPASSTMTPPPTTLKLWKTSWHSSILY
jgi:hypothetical protein